MRISPLIFLAVGSVIFFLFPDLAVASQITPTPTPSRETLTSILSTLEASSRATNRALVDAGLKTLAAAIALQWILTHWKELFQGELTSILAKSVGLITWAGAGYWLIGNQDKFYELFNQYLGLARSLSGVQFDPVSIWGNGIQLQADLAVGFYTRNGDGVWEMVKNILPGLGILVACLLILAAYGLVALSVLVAMAEFWMMMAVAPLAIALIGLNAMRDQGFAPIKGLMSVGLRIIILGVIVKTLGTVHTTALSAFRTLPADEPMTVVWYTLGGVFACAIMALYSGKIASGIASGSASFSGSDAIRGGMAMAQTTGTAVTAAATAATGVAAVGAAGGGAARSMAERMGSMARGGAVGVSPAASGSSSHSNAGGGVFGGSVGKPPPPPGAGDVFKSMGGESNASANGPRSSSGEAAAANSGAASSGENASGGGNVGGSGIRAAGLGGSAKNLTDAVAAAMAPKAVSGGEAGGNSLGNASGAGIGQSTGAKDIADAVAAAMAPKPKGVMDHLKGVAESGRRTLGELAQDNAQVSTQINTRGE